MHVSTFFIKTTELFSFTNIAEFQKQLFDNQFSCRETVAHYLAKIEEYAHLNAFIEVYGKEALKRADELDEKKKSGQPCGKLFGVVVSLKDVISYKDHKLSAASAILKDFTSIYSSTAVERLIQEDAIIIGNCNCDEFAMGNSNENSFYGRVKNALDETKVAGGSSGGSAVSVQAGLCMISLGSDTGGSVRQPADFCGIVGLKPSYGTISRHGLIAYASSFDQIGIFSLNVEDAALILSVISGKDEYDGTANQAPPLTLEPIANTSKKYKIAVFKNAIDHTSLDPEIRKSIISLSYSLKNDGHTVEEIAFDLIDYIVPAYYILTTAEASSNLSRYDGIRYGASDTSEVEDISEYYEKTRGTFFGREVKKRIMIGTFVLSEGYYDAYFTKAQQVRKMLVEYTERIFADYDIILLPTTPSTAFEAGRVSKDPIEGYLADIYTVFANLTGIAGMSIPVFKHSNGMPFGVQLLAARQNELTLIQSGSQILNRYKQY